MTNRIFELIQLQNANRGLLWTEEDKEEFAALIVLECTNMVRESSLPDAYSEPCLQAIADDIMEHFGVEE